MSNSSYSFGIGPWNYRAPKSQQDMQGMMDAVCRVYIPKYQVALAALLGCAEHAALSYQIVHELSLLQSYFQYLFATLFPFPQLTHYRPMLMFYVAEIEKCITTHKQWMALYAHDARLSSTFVSDVGSEFESDIYHEIRRLGDDFLRFRNRLHLLFDGTNVFHGKNSNMFVPVLSDINVLLQRCEMLDNECISYGVRSPLLSYISVMLMGYIFVCHIDRLHAMIQSHSIDEYGLCLTKIQFVEVVSRLYGDLAHSVTSDMDPRRRYYTRVTNPSIQSYSYLYIDEDNVVGDIVEYTDHLFYVGLDAGGDVIVVGTKKQDFEVMALCEEEMTLSVVCLGLDQSGVSELLSTQSPRKEDIQLLTNDPALCLTLHTYLDSQRGFVVTITDNEGVVADEFIFTEDELQDLQTRP